MKNNHWLDEHCEYVDPGAPKLPLTSPMAVKILKILKEHGKPMNMADIVTAVDGNTSTVTNYVTCMVMEGAIVRPAKGQFASK